METSGIEPATSWLQIERSNRNSFIANDCLKTTCGFWATQRRFPGNLESDVECRRITAESLHVQTLMGHFCRYCVPGMTRAAGSVANLERGR